MGLVNGKSVTLYCRSIKAVERNLTKIGRGHKFVGNMARRFPRGTQACPFSDCILMDLGTIVAYYIPNC